MADIFLSYSSKDRARIAPLAKALGAAGFSVWWDGDIRPGADFATTIEREIKEAKAVVVAWTAAAAQSQWVRDEAAFARNEGKLIPLLVDGAEPPMGFRQVQAIDFRDWRGDRGEPAFLALDAALRDLARDGAVPWTPAPAPKPSAYGRARAFAARRAPFIAAVALLIGVGAAVFAFRNAAKPPDTPAIAMGRVEIQPFVASPDEAERRARASSYASAFRQRLTELGVPNQSANAAGSRGEPELIITGEVAREGEKDVFAAQIEDRKSGATLWSIRRPPSEGAAYEANLAGFALKCALKRRDPALGPDYLARFIQACAHGLDGDWRAEQAAAKALYDAAPNDARAVGFLARSTMGVAWAGSGSKAQHDQFVLDGKRLAEAALKLDPKNADALFALVFAYDDTQYKEQETWLRAALAADPELGFALGRYANLLATVGRVRESTDLGLRAQLHRRNSAGATARHLAAIGDWASARRLYALIRPLDPDGTDRREMLTEVLYGDIDAASRRLAEHPELAGGNLGCWTQALAARRKEPVEPARYAEACGGGGETSAAILAIAGDLDGAFREIDAAIEEFDGRFPPQLFTPEFRDLRRDPRFWPLAARLKLVDYWLETGQWPDFCAEPDLPFDCREKAKEASP